jgi:tetratricopeptide (TPR) repeat protein
VYILTNGPMPVPDATARCEQLYEANHDDRLLRAIIASCLSYLSAMAGRFEDAERYSSIADPVLGRVDTMFAALGQMAVTEARELVGDHAGAVQAQKAKWLFFGGATDGPLDGRALDAADSLARLCCDDGRWDEAEEWVARNRHVRPRDPGRLATEARLAAHRGDHAEALKLAHEAVERAEATDHLNSRAKKWLVLAEVQRATGHPDEAEAAVTRALELYEQKGNVAAAARARSAVLTA